MDHPSRVRGLVLIGSPADLQRPLPVALSEALDSFHDPVNRDDIGRLNRMLGGQDRIPADFLDDMDTAALTIPARVWKEWLAELFAAEPPIRQADLQTDLSPVGRRRGGSPRRATRHAQSGHRRGHCKDLRGHWAPGAVGAARASRRRCHGLHRRVSDLSLAAKLVSRARPHRFRRIVLRGPPSGLTRRRTPAPWPGAQARPTGQVPQAGQFAVVSGGGVPGQVLCRLRDK